MDDVDAELEADDDEADDAPAQPDNVIPINRGKVAEKADAAEADDEDNEEAADPDNTLNGAQVTALLEIIQRVAARQLPREAGIIAMMTAFPIDRVKAEELMGEVGKTFFLDGGDNEGAAA
jgi:hypothetical protein